MFSKNRPSYRLSRPAHSFLFYYYFQMKKNSTTLPQQRSRCHDEMKTAHVLHGDLVTGYRFSRIHHCNRSQGFRFGLDGIYYSTLSRVEVEVSKEGREGKKGMGDPTARSRRQYRAQNFEFWRAASTTFDLLKWQVSTRHYARRNSWRTVSYAKPRQQKSYNPWWLIKLQRKD